MKTRGMALAACIGLLHTSAWAGDCNFIDFETLPDGTPTTDLQLIFDEYEASCGVTFELLGAPAGSGPLIAKVGAPMTAFQGDPRTWPECGVDTVTDNDTPADVATVGCSFLTDNDAVDTEAFTLRITYTDPVAQAGGLLLDIDGNEEWTITAKRADESALGSIVLSPGGVDGGASPWSLDFADEGDVIKFLELDFTGSGNRVGLAFDNFFVSTVPDAIGACCLPGGDCVITSADDCVADGGQFTAEGVECDPDPCLPTPIVESTWGEIKTNFR